MSKLLNVKGRVRWFGHYSSTTEMHNLSFEKHIRLQEAHQLCSLTTVVSIMFNYRHLKVVKFTIEHFVEFVAP